MADSSPLPPLDAEGRAAVARWAHRIRLAVAGSLVALAAWFVVLLFAPDEPWLPTLAVLFAAPLVATGVAMQWTGRCPRCRGRIAFRSGLRPPASCPTCGATFDPGAGAEPPVGG